MSRYIDADALIEKINEHLDGVYKSHEAGGEISDAETDYCKTLHLAKKFMEQVPTADVVEVVRCKDCKYAEIADKKDEQDGYTCQFHRGSIWFSGSYCSWGEKKDG